jgi:hypothetical protein
MSARTLNPQSESLCNSKMETGYTLACYVAFVPQHMLRGRDSPMEMRLPTGHQLHAARCLAGLDQRTLAKRAGVSNATLSRMESCGKNTVTAKGVNIDAVLAALERAGVEVTEDGVRLRRRAPR